MKRRQIKIDSIIKLKQTENAQGVKSPDRFSLKSGKLYHGIYTLQPGETAVVDANQNVTQVGNLKLGDTVVIGQRAVTNSDGTPKLDPQGAQVLGWYYLASGTIDQFVEADYEGTDEAAMERLREKKEHEKLARRAELVNKLGGSTTIENLMATI